MKSQFIAIEGQDGSGKSTQAKLLCQALNAAGRRAYLTREPSQGTVGRICSEELKRHDTGRRFKHAALALCFAADRLNHFDFEIEPKLKEGFDVVTDRYVMSSLVYQGLNLPKEWVAQINCYAPKPDITILIDLDEKNAKLRRESRRNEVQIFDDMPTQLRVREHYLQLAKSNNAIVVDGAGTVDEVAARVWSRLKGILK